MFRPFTAIHYDVNNNPNCLGDNRSPSAWVLWQLKPTSIFICILRPTKNPVDDDIICGTLWHVRVPCSSVVDCTNTSPGSGCMQWWSLQQQAVCRTQITASQRLSVVWRKNKSCLFGLLKLVVNAELSPKRCWLGPPRSQEVGKEGDYNFRYLALHCHHHNGSFIKMGTLTAVLMFH